MEIVESRKGGTNTPLHISKLPSGKEIVVKQYGYEPIHSVDVKKLSNNQWVQVIKDWVKVRKAIHKCGINVPVLVGITFVDDSLTYDNAVESLSLETITQPLDISKAKQSKAKQSKAIMSKLLD